MSGASAAPPKRPSARAASSAGEVPHGARLGESEDPPVPPLALPAAVNRIHMRLVCEQGDEGRDGADAAWRSGQPCLARGAGTGIRIVGAQGRQSYTRRRVRIVRGAHPAAR